MLESILKNQDAVFFEESTLASDHLQQRISVVQEGVRNLSVMFYSSIEVDADQFRLYSVIC